MTEPDDMSLVREFVANESEAAFAALVQRHVNLVFSTAQRSVGSTHAAEEISQAVFIILAQKAGKLSPHTVVSGWLYQTTRLTAANFLRGEIRRQKREQEAYMESTLNGGGDASSPSADQTIWPQIAPLLDGALEKLGERDRNAIVLRFFENKNLREVGLALGASEDAAKMRVNRALEKLRKIFGKRGAIFSVAAIAGAVSANSVHAAPVGLAKTISIVAITKGAAAGGSTLALAKGALKIMAWTKTKTAIVSGLIVLLVAGSATVAIYNWENELLFQHHREQPSDAMVRQKLPGTWTETGADGVIKTITIDSNGHTTMKLSGRSSGSSEGTTQVKNGFLIGTITKSSQRITLPFTNSVRIIWIDDRELVMPGDRNSQVVWKKIKP